MPAFMVMMTLRLIFIPLLVLTFRSFGQGHDSTLAIARRIYMTRNLPYPEAALEAKVEGIIIVQFRIDEHCNIKDKKILQGLGYGLDELALSVIDRKFEDQVTSALYPCSPDTLQLPIRFVQR